MSDGMERPLIHSQTEGSYVKQLFNGDIPLVTTYWVYGVLIGNLGSRLVNLLIENNYASIVTTKAGPFVVMAIGWLVVAYTLFIAVAIWRSAGKYQGSATWSGLARGVAILGSIAMLGELNANRTMNNSDAGLAEEIRIFNNGLPLMIDSETRLDNASMRGRDVLYNYTLLKYTADKLDLDVFKAKLGVRLMDSSCSTIETRKLLNEGRLLSYVYRGNDGKPIYEFKISKDNCFSDEQVSPTLDVPTAQRNEVSPQATVLSAADIFDSFNEAVVLVRTYDAKGNLVGFGSGFNVAPEGLIVTNLHVILSGGEVVDIKFPKHGVYEKVFIEGFSNTDVDLALLRIDGKDLPVVNVPDIVSPKVGERVYTISNPEGLVNTLSEGLISASRSLDGVELYQITAPISHGSSGGAVFDQSGNVIGVATKILSQGQNLNFMTSMNEIKNIEVFEEYFTLKQLLDAALDDQSQ